MSGGEVGGPDLTVGIAEEALAEGAMIAGHVGDEGVLLARTGGEVFAIAAACTHYGGPLADGLMEGETVRCPWHHACFSLRTGEALAAPALMPASCWSVVREGGRITVAEKRAPPRKSRRPEGGRMVIIGGGAAGFAAAEMLRREGHAGPLTIVSSDADAPYDRPNLSKDYLAGSAPEEWIPLRPPEFYAENEIELRLGATAEAVDPASRTVTLRPGDRLAYDKLLIATGAEPIRLELPGGALDHVRTLRSLADSRDIIARARPGARAVVIGASFIGLEAAASLRARDLEVHVVAPEARPMERVLGQRLGDFIKALHERHGVGFHLEHTPQAIEPGHVRLDDGSVIEADLVVMGVGVRPRIALAEKAGLTIDRGVLVDGFLKTSAPDIYAAGDIARWPDAFSGEAIRVEHWVVAERQGQTAARNMLGARERYVAAPFFWSQHYDVPINYVGHAEGWDDVEQSGNPADWDFVMRYRKGGRTLAVVTVGADRESLEAARAMGRA